MQHHQNKYDEIVDSWWSFLVIKQLFKNVTLN